MPLHSLISRCRRWFASRRSKSKDGPPVRRRSLQVEALEDRTVPAAGFSLTPADVMTVNTLFVDLLGRTADPAAVIVFSEQLSMGFTPLQLSQEIMMSPEFQIRQMQGFAGTAPNMLFNSPFGTTFSPFGMTVFSPFGQTAATRLGSPFGGAFGSPFGGASLISNPFAAASFLNSPFFGSGSLGSQFQSSLFGTTLGAPFFGGANFLTVPFSGSGTFF